MSTHATPKPFFDRWFFAAVAVATAAVLAGNLAGAGTFLVQEFAVALALVTASSLAAQLLNRFAMRFSLPVSMGIGMLANGVRLAIVLMVMFSLAFHFSLDLRPYFLGALAGCFVYLMYEVLAIHRASLQTGDF